MAWPSTSAPSSLRVSMISSAISSVFPLRLSQATNTFTAASTDPQEWRCAGGRPGSRLSQGASRGHELGQTVRLANHGGEQLPPVRLGPTMRLSQYLFETFRHTAESGPGAAGLLHRAGYLRGRRDWLPLGQHLRRQLVGQLTNGLHSFAAAEADLDLPAGEHARLTHLAATLSGMLRSHRQLPRTVWQARSGVFEAFSFGQAAS